tara:strand:- start:261 stop:491 length:231 start_codon:yes stop_codon:yes gene_type:complete
MCLSEKAISEKEAKAMGAVPFSFPCRIATKLVADETWILNNMIKDLEAAGKRWVVVNAIDRNSRSYAKALELWKIN